MKTQFTSHQHGITEEHLKSHFKGVDVEEFILWNIHPSPSGHGHYSVSVELEIDNKIHTIHLLIDDMQLIDAWQSGLENIWAGPEEDYESWDEVVSSLLSKTEIDNEIIETLKQKAV